MTHTRETLIELKKFESKHYYEQLKDSSYLLDKQLQLRARPTAFGAHLIAEYYKNKYACEISLYIPLYYENYILGLRDFIKDFKIELPSLRQNAKKEKEYRKAFLINFALAHTIPIIYINEKGKEALIYANSLVVCKNQINYLADLKLETGISCYYIPIPRQRDEMSCRNDALIIARDATAKKEGEYIIKALMPFLEKQEIALNGVHPLQKIPLHFLKTAQISEFLKYFESKDMKEIPIHKNQTLTLFRDRYTLKAARVLIEYKPHIKNVPSYLFAKGIKNCGIIKIQFYANQLLPEVRKEFIKAAKKLLKDNAEQLDITQINLLHALATEFNQKESTSKKGFWAQAFEWFTQEPTAASNKPLTKEDLHWLHRNHF